MKTLAILSRKGGAGKTTVALHLAVAARRRTVIMDCDPQKSAADWWRSRQAETPELVEGGVGQLAEIQQAAAADGVELMVVDTRPSAEDDALEAARAADLVLIVLKPTILDLRAVAATVDTVKAAGASAVFLINQAPAGRNGIEASIVQEAVEALAGYGLPACPVVLHNRASYHAALIDGRAVIEAEPSGKAANEIDALWAYVEKRLWQSARR
jgi:chromosome partitioning protein